MTRASAALVGLAALLVSTPGLSPPRAQAAQLPMSQSAAQQCIARGEVYVLAVNESGGVVASGCVGRPSTGEQALRAVASIRERGADRGFVCQINGSPGQCIEGKDFVRFGQRYWQYFHGTPGGSWSYSQRGYTSYTPATGSVEGWCYGQTGVGCPQRLANVVTLGGLSKNKPEPTPSAQKTTATQPPVTTTRPRATARPTPGQPRATRPTVPGSTSATSTPTTAPSSMGRASSAPPSPSRASTASTSPSSTGVSSAATTQGASTSPSGTASEQPPIAQPPGGIDNGTPWGVIATGSLVALGAAGYGIVRVRARRSDDLQ